MPKMELMLLNEHFHSISTQQKVFEMEKGFKMTLDDDLQQKWSPL